MNKEIQNDKQCQAWIQFASSIVNVNEMVVHNTSENEIERSARLLAKRAAIFADEMLKQLKERYPL